MAKVGRACLLDERVAARIIVSIKAGAFDWVAAEAAGIGRRTFYDWLARGEAGEQPFAAFLEGVRTARAFARAGAEKVVHDDSPLSWLRLGPGRERAGAPGWTSPGKPAGDEGEDAVNKVLQGVLEAIAEERGRAGD